MVDNKSGKSETMLRVRVVLMLVLIKRVQLEFNNICEEVAESIVYG